jgi:hypothetical protein
MLKIRGSDIFILILHLTWPQFFFLGEAQEPQKSPPDMQK